MVASPVELSQLLIARHNARDLAAMLELFDPDVEFIRPGPMTVRGVDAVRVRYLEDWRTYDESLVEVTRIVQSSDEVAVEIQMTLRRGGAVAAVEGAVFHQWRDGRLVRYRAYFDPMP